MKTIARSAGFFGSLAMVPCWDDQPAGPDTPTPDAAPPLDVGHLDASDAEAENGCTDAACNDRCIGDSCPEHSCPDTTTTVLADRGDPIYSHEASLVADANGGVHMVQHNGQGEDTLWYAYLAPSADDWISSGITGPPIGWIDKMPIPSDAAGSIAVDSTLGVHVIYSSIPSVTGEGVLAYAYRPAEGGFRRRSNKHSHGGKKRR